MVGERKLCRLFLLFSLSLISTSTVGASCWPKLVAKSLRIYDRVGIGPPVQSVRHPESFSGWSVAQSPSDFRTVSHAGERVPLVAYQNGDQVSVYQLTPTPQKPTFDLKPILSLQVDGQNRIIHEIHRIEILENGLLYVEFALNNPGEFWVNFGYGIFDIFTGSSLQAHANAFRSTLLSGHRIAFVTDLDLVYGTTLLVHRVDPTSADTLEFEIPPKLDAQGKPRDLYGMFENTARGQLMVVYADSKEFDEVFFYDLNSGHPIGNPLKIPLIDDEIGSGVGIRYRGGQFSADGRYFYSLPEFKGRSIKRIDLETGGIEFSDPLWTNQLGESGKFSRVSLRDFNGRFKVDEKSEKLKFYSRDVIYVLDHWGDDRVHEEWRAADSNGEPLMDPSVVSVAYDTDLSRRQILIVRKLDELQRDGSWQLELWHEATPPTLVLPTPKPRIDHIR